MPVIVLSGHGLAEEAQALLELGAAGCASKPVEMDALARLVARHHGGSAVRALPRGLLHPD